MFLIYMNDNYPVKVTYGSGWINMIREVQGRITLNDILTCGTTLQGIPTILLLRIT